MHWSGGKDSALALSMLLRRDDVRIDRLVTTTAPDDSAATVHDVPTALLRAQAERVGLPLQTVPLAGDGLAGYAAAMAGLGEELRDAGVDAVAFGDLSCSDGRRHREAMFGPLGIEVVEPLWGLDSSACVERFLASGLEAVTVVVDGAVLDVSRVGVALDRAFVESLPAGVDPCGEFGEYHTFVHAGPLFSSPVELVLPQPRRLVREIGTTQGVRTFEYWTCTPQPASLPVS
jgi:uncharacterized protein (TIGR00290 family)